METRLRKELIEVGVKSGFPKENTPPKSRIAMRRSSLYSKAPPRLYALALTHPMKNLKQALLASLTLTGSLVAATYDLAPTLDTALVYNFDNNDAALSFEGATTLSSFNGNDDPGAQPFALPYHFFPLFHWDLSSYSGQIVTGTATFTVYAESLAASPQTGASLPSLSLNLLSRAFDSSTTFNNYTDGPPYAPLGEWIGTNTIPGSTVTLPDGSAGPITFSISASVVQSWIDSPSSNLGIGIYQNHDGSAWNISLSSNESSTLAQRPVLTFTTAAIPEPSSYALIGGAACLGLVVYRRRRS